MKRSAIRGFESPRKIPTPAGGDGGVAPDEAQRNPGVRMHRRAIRGDRQVPFDLVTPFAVAPVRGLMEGWTFSPGCATLRCASPGATRRQPFGLHEWFWVPLLA